MSFQLEHRDANANGDERSRYNGKEPGRPGNHRDQWVAVEVLAGAQNTAGIEKRVRPAPLIGLQISGGQGSGKITADGKETGMANGDLARIAHQQPKSDDHQAVVRRHGQLGQVKLGFSEGRQLMNTDHQQAERNQGPLFSPVH